MINSPFSKQWIRKFAPILIVAILIPAFFFQTVGMAATPEPTDQLVRASECRAGDGWKWTYGSIQPEVAEQVQQALHAIGVDSSVIARSFGETDSCGNFRQHATDFFISINKTDVSIASEQQEIVEKIVPTLTEMAKPSLGNVQIKFSNSETILNIRPDLRSPDGMMSGWEHAQNPLIAAENYLVSFNDYPIFLPLIARSYTPPKVITRKVYVIVYDPILSNGQYLSDYLYWNKHTDLTQATVDFFREASRGMLNYQIVDTTIVTDGWPRKVDGFRYTEAEYLAAIRGERPFHSPDTVDYNAIVNSPVFDICGRANRGEIDEVWIYNGPGFGFYESTLVGPNAYWYNSPPVPLPHSCNRLIPIMGPSPERGLAEAVHNFGHRAEATMERVYGSWQQNRTSHNWERFALVKALSPDYSYSGCGNIHYPPNGISDYDYGNPSMVLSNCHDFANYPNLADPVNIALPVTCSQWGCDHLDFLKFWFSRLPSNPGCGPDGAANNWWEYFSTPALALNRSSPCQ